MARRSAALEPRDPDLLRLPLAKAVSDRLNGVRRKLRAILRHAESLTPEGLANLEAALDALVQTVSVSRALSDVLSNEAKLSLGPLEIKIPVRKSLEFLGRAMGVKGRP